MGNFLFYVANRLFCFQVSFCPVKRGNRAGSSRNEVDYSWRGSQTSFSLLDCRCCENFWLPHFSIFLLEKKSWWNRAPWLINCQFSDYTTEKWVSPAFSQPRPSRSGKLIWVPLREYSDSRREQPARFLRFMWQKQTWKQKKYLLET